MHGAVSLHAMLVKNKFVMVIQIFQDDPSMRFFASCFYSGV